MTQLLPTPTLPAEVPKLPENPSEAEILRFNADHATYRLISDAIRGIAQQNTAIGMNRAADAQFAVLAASTPQPPSREEAILRIATDIVGKQARGGRSNAKIADDAVQVATAMFDLLQPAMVAPPLVPVAVPSPAPAPKGAA
jgi:hypothetical protein